MWNSALNWKVSTSTRTLVLHTPEDRTCACTRANPYKCTYNIYFIRVHVMNIRLNVFLAAGGVPQWKHSLPVDYLPPRLIEDCEKGSQLHSDLLNYCIECVVSSLRVVLRTFQLHVFSTTSTSAIMDHFIEGERPSGSFPFQEMVMASESSF